MEKICVAIRVRPDLSSETYDGNGSFWKIDDNRISLHKHGHGTPVSAPYFAFDHVFDESSTNAQVYAFLIKDVIRAAVQGFNGTAFAYGQTSSGKTFTMNGSKSDPGIIHQAIKDIFERIQMESEREFLIRVSYLEIYNEEINDLLAVENQKLQIHESLERGVYVSGLREEIVNDAGQVLKLIKSGEVNRHFGETNMNVRSSRSHTIFRMVIESKGNGSNVSDEFSSGDAVRVSVLNLVDLAGSERIAKTGAGGVRLKEGKYINKSLMVLGNVINKLSEGVKQRGHIPYRDSKLTRILQPALGGNAKTSIICTVAPEEIHIEETKGTLQFASRAKRITNCAQVNEILTDAALLRRQKLEIEDLRKKLEGSRAEELEKEILKLRNDMLKYELEHEKLASELEEERKLHNDRIDDSKNENSSSCFNYSVSDKISGQGHDFGKQITIEANSNLCIPQEDAFRTPTFKAVPSAFVARRGNFSRLPDFSPLPDAFSNMADEDTWLRMNKGYKADLDALQITPARRVQSFPPNDVSPGCSNENYAQEVLDLKKQLQLCIEQKNELQSNYTQQVQLNNQLSSEISELKHEALLVQEIPQTLRASVASCKEMYEDVMSTIQVSAVDEKRFTSSLISSTNEIGVRLLSALETHLSNIVEGYKNFAVDDSIIHDQHNALREELNNTITPLILSKAQAFEDESSKSFPCRCKPKECNAGEETATWEELHNELETMKEKCESLKIDYTTSINLLEASKAKYSSVEKEFQKLKHERECLQQTTLESAEKLAMVQEVKEKALKELSREVKLREDLELQIKDFSVAFAARQRKLISFQTEFKSKLENLKAQNPVLVPKLF